jgi:acyl carrier protein
MRIYRFQAVRPDVLDGNCFRTGIKLALQPSWHMAYFSPFCALDGSVFGLKKGVSMTETTEAYVQKIVDYLKESVLLDPSQEIPLDRSLLEAGILDSYGIVDLLTFIEGEYGLAIPDQDITREKMGSIRKMARYIEAHRLVRA